MRWSVVQYTEKTNRKNTKFSFDKIGKSWNKTCKLPVFGVQNSVHCPLIFQSWPAKNLVIATVSGLSAHLPTYFSKLFKKRKNRILYIIKKFLRGVQSFEQSDFK